MQSSCFHSIFKSGVPAEFRECVDDSFVRMCHMRLSTIASCFARAVFAQSMIGEQFACLAFCRLLLVNLFVYLGCPNRCCLAM